VLTILFAKFKGSGTYEGETPKANSILEVINFDLIGPIQQSFTGKRVHTYLPFIDNFSRKKLDFSN